MRYTLETNARERRNYDLRQARKNKETGRLANFASDLDNRPGYRAPDVDDTAPRMAPRAPKYRRAMIYASVALAAFLAFSGASEARGVGSAHHVARNNQGRQIGEPSSVAVTGFRAYFTRGASGNAN
jgi:hypothetical protein